MRRTSYIILLWLISIFLSCNNTEVPEHGEETLAAGTDFLSFSLKSETGEIFTAFFINDSIVHVKIPHFKDKALYTPVFTTNAKHVIEVATGDEVKSCATKIDFSDFVNPVEFRLISSTGDQSLYKVNVYDLPVLLLKTPNAKPIDSKTERVEGCQLSLIDNEGVLNELGTAGVRGRGNSTWEQPKKPYNVKFDSKQSVLGMKPSKHWLLMSQPFYDRSQLRNATALEMARLSDFDWTPSGDFCELILNGEHKGLYFICEKIRVESGKIDLKQKQSEIVDIPPFLIESFIVGESPNTMTWTDQCFVTDYINETGPYWVRRTMGWEIKYPDEATIEQRESIKSYLNNIESILLNDESIACGSYREHVDISSFCDWWLVQEAAANFEASKSCNVYLYAGADGKLKIGPPWDFDAWTFGSYGDLYIWFCKDDAVYYSRLFKDPVFIAMVKEKWSRYKPIWRSEIISFIDKKYDQIHHAALRNETMGEWYRNNHYSEVSYEQLISGMKDFVISQLEWMDSEILQF